MTGLYQSVSTLDWDFFMKPSSNDQWSISLPGFSSLSYALNGRSVTFLSNEIIKINYAKRNIDKDKTPYRNGHYYNRINMAFLYVDLRVT